MTPTRPASGRASLALPAVLLLVTALACEDGTGVDDGDLIASVRVAPASAEIEVGQTRTFEATVTNRRGEVVEPDVTWSASDPGVAGIEAAGGVTAVATGLAAGQVTVTASAGDVTGQATLTVVDPGPPAAPSDVVAQAVSDDAIVVGWTDNASDETRFVVERESGSSGASGDARSAAGTDGPGRDGPSPSFEEVGTVDPDVTTFRDEGLPASTAFRYRVRACNQRGCAGGEDGDGTTSGTVETHAPLVVETTDLPDGELGAGYEAVLAARGGDGASYAWSLREGALPDGLGLSEEGVLAGTPAEGGVFQVTVRVTSVEQTADADFTLVVPRAAVALEDLLAEEIVVQRVDAAPLAVEAVVRTTEPVTATVTVPGDLPTTRTVSGAATELYLPVIGLYPGRENAVEVTLTALDGASATAVVPVATDPLPDFFPDVTVTTADRAAMEPGWTLASFSIGDAANDRFLTHPFAFDANGDVRWYLDLSEFGGMAYMLEPLRNGNLVTGHGQSVYEYDVLGRKVNQWDFPGYLFHHDVIEKEDGNLVVAVDVAGGETVEDHVIEVDRETGDVVNVWDFRDILDPEQFAYMNDPVDWFHMNAVVWDEDDDALIVSGRNQSAVVKVTAAGELVWILAPHRGWDGGSVDLSSYLLTAVNARGAPFPDYVQQGDLGAEDDAFHWPWGQHAPLILPNGNLFLFDNGLLRNFVGRPDPERFSRGVEYAVDEDAMTIRQVWQYGRERGFDYFSGIVSDVDYLPTTGHRLVVPGITHEGRAWVTEVTEGREVVFEAYLGFKNLLGTGEQVWGGFDLVYRAERVDFFP